MKTSLRYNFQEYLLQGLKKKKKQSSQNWPSYYLKWKISKDLMETLEQSAKLIGGEGN